MCGLIHNDIPMKIHLHQTLVLHGLNENAFLLSFWHYLTDDVLWKASKERNRSAFWWSEKGVVLQGTSHLQERRFENYCIFLISDKRATALSFQHILGNMVNGKQFILGCWDGSCGLLFDPLNMVPWLRPFQGRIMRHAMPSKQNKWAVPLGSHNPLFLISFNEVPNPNHRWHLGTVIKRNEENSAKKYPLFSIGWLSTLMGCSSDLQLIFLNYFLSGGT